MTARDAAVKLGITKNTVLKHIDRGNLDATDRIDPFGRPYKWISPAALKKFEANRRQPGNPNWTPSEKLL